MIKNYQKGVKGFTKVEPNRLRIKKFLFCQTDKETENLKRASELLGISRADVIRLALQDCLNKLNIDYLKEDEIIGFNQLNKQI